MFKAVRTEAGTVVRPVMDTPDLLRIAERIIAQNQLVVEANCGFLNALASPEVVVETVEALPPIAAPIEPSPDRSAEQVSA